MEAMKDNFGEHYTEKQLVDWFLAWNECEDVEVTYPDLVEFLISVQYHHNDEHGAGMFFEDFYSRRLPLTSPFMVLTLQEDFDFADFTDYDNQFLIAVWNTYFGCKKENEDEK